LPVALWRVNSDTVLIGVVKARAVRRAIEMDKYNTKIQFIYLWNYGNFEL